MSDYHYVYRFFAEDGALLYVGSTKNTRTRFGQHQTDKPWWDEVVRITMDRFLTRAAAHAAETDAIRDEKPRYNVAGADPLVVLARPSFLPKGVDLRSSGKFRGRFIRKGKLYQREFDTPTEAAAWIVRTRQELVLFGEPKDALVARRSA